MPELREVHAAAVVAAVALGAILAAACDDGDECVSTPACDEAGALRCGPEADQVESCRADVCGNLIWSVDEACLGLLTCVDGAEGPRCACEDQCDAGASECDRDLARFCDMGADGCLYWREQSCARVGQVCVLTSGRASCVDACEPDCFQIGATRCRSDMEIERCAESDAGCLTWQVDALCDQPLTVCDESSGAAECVDCEASCPTEGEPRCEGGNVETCTDPGNECLAWAVTTECPSVQPCDTRGGVTACYGEIRCDDGADDDLDLLVDCDDPECFGVEPACATETNCGDGEDNDDDGAADCADDDCAVQAATPSAASEVVFTELHYAPVAVDDTVGEYVELLNTSGRDLDLRCCWLNVAEAWSELPTVAMPAGARVVLAGNDDPALNGGIEGAVAVELGLPDHGGEELALECAGLTIDALHFRMVTEGWPAGGDGVSAQLSSRASSAVANDATTSWCDSTAPFGDGDLGTPGLPNDACAATVYLEEDFEEVTTWTTTDEWEWGAPDPAYAEGPAACAAGTGCVGTNLDGAHRSLCEGTGCALFAPVVDLSGATAPVLSFDLWLDTQPGSDGAGLVAAGADLVWAPLEPLSPTYDAPVPDPVLWSGPLTPGDAWRPVVVDLSRWAGEAELHLGWVLESDALENRAGAYVDDVVVWEP
jgi:hypothetical protein